MRVDEFQILPRYGGIEIVAHPRREILEARILAQHGRQIAKLMRPPTHADILDPGGAQHRLHGPPCRPHQAGRTCQSRSIVTVARTGHWAPAYRR